MIEFLRKYATAFSSATIGLIALAVRFYYLFAAQVDVPLRADAGQYFRIAMNVVTYGVFSTANPQNAMPIPDSYRAPGYPSLIALPLALTGNLDVAYWFVLVLQGLLGGAVAVLMFMLARRWLATGYAFAAGLLVALWPHLITQGGYVLTEAVFGAALAIATFVATRAIESGRVMTCTLAGVLFGVAALVNEMIVLFPLLVFLLMLLVQRRSRAALFIIAALLPPVLWSVRDANIHAPVAVSSGERLFENVLVGMEPDFNRYYRDQSDPRGIEARVRVGQGSAQYVVDKQAAYAAVVARLQKEPMRYFIWFLNKPLLLWTWSIGQGAGDIYVYPMLTSPFETEPLYRSIAAICHGMNGLLTAAAFGMVLMMIVAALRRRLHVSDLPLSLCVLMFCYATFVYSLLNPDVRYANPFRPFEILLAVTFIARVHTYLRTRNQRSSVGAGDRTLLPVETGA